MADLKLPTPNPERVHTYRRTEYKNIMIQMDSGTFRDAVLGRNFKLRLQRAPGAAAGHGAASPRPESISAP
ncbi:hypothetical protein EVAR_11248_1 [Eumeta japonica]|uniref:Uncharacterized protein n=1 Tax=Eumeta variegata TaxID=151549 RepID=A0A4C1UKR5_EUMVA|nr:hypothetical protein EVAR_11248_1 [Eumeta japonica]